MQTVQATHVCAKIQMQSNVQEGMRASAHINNIHITEYGGTLLYRDGAEKMAACTNILWQACTPELALTPSSNFINQPSSSSIK